MKDTLRKRLLNLRNNIENKDIKSNDIINKIISKDIYKSSKVIALYYPIKGEVNIIPLINYSLDLGKIVVLPKMFNNSIKFYEIKSLNDLEDSVFSIKEPKTYLKEYNNIDLMIVPGITFDKNNYRLGYGNGCYDKYLSINNSSYTIGVTYKELLIDSINPKEYDINMKEVITHYLFCRNSIVGQYR